MKTMLATAVCALALGFAALPAVAAPLAGATQSGIEAQSGVEEVRQRRWHRGNRGWRQHRWGRRCWTSCTGIGTVRICKRKCR